MRAPMLITAFLVYVFAMPTAIEAGQAKAVPEVGVLFAVARPDKDAVIDSLNAVHPHLARASVVAAEKLL